MIIKPTIKTLMAIAETKGYPIFLSNEIYNYNLNIWGIRSASSDTVYFNDMFIIFYQSIKGNWTVDQFNGTTDPSDKYLLKPINPKGAAILTEGHHKALWAYGFHKNRKDHKALVQYTPCVVYRDNDKDSKIDYVDPSGRTLVKDKGMFGINMHRTSDYASKEVIGLHSAGCQVHADIERYNKVFIPLIQSCIMEGHKTFSYTLIKESDLIL